MNEAGIARASDDPARILMEDPPGATPHGSITSPIYQTSLFSHADFDAFREAITDQSGSYLYSRGNNPTIRDLETKLAALEGGEDARMFSSGVSAIAAASMSLLQAGDHVVCVEDCYSWTRYLFVTYLARFGMSVTFVPGTSVDEFEAALTPQTRLIFLESPTSVTFRLQDLRTVGELARQRGVHTVIDNTWATPLYQHPLELGIDLVVHSVSKYIGGHSDLVAGVVIGSKALMDRIFWGELLPLGHIATPSNAWLIQRGLRTLQIRLKQHYESATKIAVYLQGHPKVDRVIYPPLSSHPQHELFTRQMHGGNGLITISLADPSVVAIRRFTNELRHFRIGVSWGGFESLVFPMAARLSPERVIADGNERLIRLHIGLDAPETLQKDLSEALKVL